MVVVHEKSDSSRIDEDSITEGIRDIIQSETSLPKALSINEENAVVTKKGNSSTDVTVDVQRNEQYRILCINSKKQVENGSYQIRCRDLKTWADRCATEVRFDIFSR